jgi:hypothetical protein
VSSSLPFMPLSVESFVCLGASALPLLRSLADHVVQAGSPGLCPDALISGALRDLGVALCRGNASLDQSGLYALSLRLAGPRCVASLAPRLRWSEVARGCLLDGCLG